MLPSPPFPSAFADFSFPSRFLPLCRAAGSLSALSGGTGLSYREVKQPRATAPKARSALFRQRERDEKKAADEVRSEGEARGMVGYATHKCSGTGCSGEGGVGRRRGGGREGME